MASAGATAFRHLVLAPGSVRLAGAAGARRAWAASPLRVAARLSPSQDGSTAEPSRRGAFNFRAFNAIIGGGASASSTGSLAGDLFRGAGQKRQAASASAGETGMAAEGAASDQGGAGAEGAKEDDSLKLLSAVSSLPHPDKEERGGEDSHYISPDGHSTGVADGVGGWAEVGVDAGEYARRLMSEAARRVAEDPPGEAAPLAVLVDAYNATRVIGSSTACILTLQKSAVHAANLGDSGFLIVRGGAVVFRCPSQQHGFNFPFQLGTESTDRPDSADLFDVPVLAGDVVVLGTDGLFDNVFDKEVAEVVHKAIRAGYGPQQVANAIGMLARHRASSTQNLTPFAVAARDSGFFFQGGKMDDITVVVSFVVAEKDVAKMKPRKAGEGEGEGA